MDIRQKEQIRTRLRLMHNVPAAADVLSRDIPNSVMTAEEARVEAEYLASVAKEEDNEESKERRKEYVKEIVEHTELNSRDAEAATSLMVLSDVKEVAEKLQSSSNEEKKEARVELGLPPDPPKEEAKIEAGQVKESGEDKIGELEKVALIETVLSGEKPIAGVADAPVPVSAPKVEPEAVKSESANKTEVKSSRGSLRKDNSKILGVVIPMLAPSAGRTSKIDPAA